MTDTPMPNKISCKHGHLARSCQICDLERELAEAKAELAEAKVDFAMQVNLATVAECTCGGVGPDDKHTCPACMVYHRLKGTP
jgi:hypothetical protein